MELNFDKEIDALLRKTAKSGTFAGGNGANSTAHIDADAISAFAENALPEKTRALYMTHIADCERCRKILSNLIVLNSEAAASAASFAEAPGIALAPVPWYRKLFLFPNLAYTMGALVLVFGGMIGFLVFQNTANRELNVSQANTYDIQRPGTLSSEPQAVNNSSATANSPTNSNTAPVGRMPSFDGMSFNSNAMGGEASSEAKNKVGGNDKALEPQPSTSGPPQDDILTDRGEPDAVLKERKAENTQRAEKKTDEMLAATKPAPPPPPVAASQAPAPAKNEPNKAYAKDTVGRAARDADENITLRKVAGKSFNRRDGVWYDSSYTGQATTDIRRGTTDYQKLNSKVRSIAESLAGTVVVVWKDKAYRIQ